MTVSTTTPAVRLVTDGVGVAAQDEVAEAVTLAPRRGQPPAGSGVCAGLALAGTLSIAAPSRRPLAMTLIAAIAVTLAYKKQLAAPNRSSVKAKAYPSQPGAPQQAMRQAPSEETASGASVRGAPTRSVRGRERKREGGQERPGVSDLEGVKLADGVTDRLDVIEEDAVKLEELEVGAVKLGDTEELDVPDWLHVREFVGRTNGIGRHG